MRLVPQHPTDCFTDAARIQGWTLWFILKEGGGDLFWTFGSNIRVKESVFGRCSSDKGEKVLGC